MNIRSIAILLLVPTMLLAACGNKSDQENTPEKPKVTLSVFSPGSGGVSRTQGMIGRVVGDPEVTISSQSVGVLRSVGPRIGESIAIGAPLASLDAQTNTTNISLSNAQTALANAKSVANSTLVSLSADLESAKIQHENAISSKKSVYETTALQIELASLTSQNNTAQAKTLLEQAELSLANFATTKKDALSSLDDRSSTLAKTIDANLLQVVSSLEPAIESADKILGTTEKNKNANDTYEPYLGAKVSGSVDRANVALLQSARLLNAYQSVTGADATTRLKAAREANTATVELYRTLTLVLQNSISDVNRFPQTQIDSLLSQVSARQQGLIPLETGLTSLENSLRDITTQRSTTQAGLDTQELSLKKSLEIAKKQNGLIAGSDTVATAQISEKNLESTKAQVAQARESADNALRISSANLASLEAKIAAQKTQTNANIDSAQGQKDLANVAAKNGAFASPIAGVVTARLVEPGALVSQGTPLFTIATNAKKIVRLDVPLEIAQSLRSRTTVEISRISSPLILTGSVVRVSTAPDVNTKLYRIDVVASGDVLSFGEVVEVRTALALTQSGSGSITLPMNALIPKSQGRYEVWIVEDNRLAKREVILGAISADTAEILSGILSDAQVTLPGNYAEGDEVTIVQD